MALRDKLRAQSQPLLDPGETIQGVFMGQSGPTPYVGLLTPLYVFFVKQVVVVATDQRIVVMRRGIFTVRPKRVLATEPRDTQIGPLSGLWGRIELGGVRYQVHRRFHKDVAAIDADRSVLTTGTSSVQAST